MKALKEKRISLRSLWRRGLVILSLFALVFASCADSTEGGGSSSGGRKVLDVTFKGPLKGNQYLGQDVNLEDLEIIIRYGDELQTKTVKWEDEKSNFSTFPRIATGLYNNKTGDFTGMEKVRVYYDAGNGSIFSSDMGFAKPVVGIRRDNTLTDTWDDITPPDNGATEVFSSSLQLVGDLATKAYYADTQDFDFTGLTLWATYDDGSELPVKFQNVSWRVLPDYNRNGKGLPPNKETGAYAGYVYVTVGADIHDWLKPYGGEYVAGSTKWNGGVTARKVIPTVYTVKDRGGIEWDSDGVPKMANYFFFEENTPAAWTQRLIDANAGIIVNYTGGAAPRPFKIADLAKQELIYWNPNTVPGVDDCGVTPIDFHYVAKAPDKDNAKLYELNPNPQIEVYYRGAKLPLDVDVYSVYRGLVFQTKSGEFISMEEFHEDDEDVWDNDVDWDIGDNEKTFLKKTEMKVFARYRAYNNSAKEEQYELKLWPSAEKGVDDEWRGEAGPYDLTDADTAEFINYATKFLGWVRHPTEDDKTMSTTTGRYYYPIPKEDKYKDEDGVPYTIQTWKTGPYFRTNYEADRARVYDVWTYQSKPKVIKGSIRIIYEVNTWDVENYLLANEIFGKDRDVYYSDKSVLKDASLSGKEKDLGTRIFGPAVKNVYGTEWQHLIDFDGKVRGDIEDIKYGATYVTKKPIVKKAKISWQLPGN